MDPLVRISFLIKGSGKTALLEHCMDLLLRKCQYDEDEVARCATTGIASSLFGGQTLDSWAGFFPQLLVDAARGRNIDEAAAYIAKYLLEKNTKAYIRWCQVKCLFIDEGILIFLISQCRCLIPGSFS